MSQRANYRVVAIDIAVLPFRWSGETARFGHTGVYGSHDDAIHDDACGFCCCITKQTPTRDTTLKLAGTTLCVCLDCSSKMSFAKYNRFDTHCQIL